MEVTKDTKISDIINTNKEAINTIASINKHFKKLKNPILRKVLASKISIKEASKIGGISINEFLEKLEKIGFKVVYDNDKSNEIIVEKKESHQLNIVSFDVRPILDEGLDPFKEIMRKIKGLQSGETLKIISTFEPIPLIKILREKGYKVWTEPINEQEYHTFFHKETSQDTSEILKSMPIKEGSFDETLASYGGNLKEIEVRHLEMPEPMVTILATLEKLPENYALLVNHKKVPQFLLPELEKRNYTWLSKEIEIGYTLLLIYKLK